jgi:hypothetical protein
MLRSRTWRPHYVYLHYIAGVSTRFCQIRILPLLKIRVRHARGDTNSESRFEQGERDPILVPVVRLASAEGAWSRVPDRSPRIRSVFGCLMELQENP